MSARARRREKVISELRRVYTALRGVSYLLEEDDVQLRHYDVIHSAAPNSGVNLGDLRNSIDEEINTIRLEAKALLQGYEASRRENAELRKKVDSLRADMGSLADEEDDLDED
jgi:hypothetical protein